MHCVASPTARLRKRETARLLCGDCTSLQRLPSLSRAQLARRCLYAECPLSSAPNSPLLVLATPGCKGQCLQPLIAARALVFRRCSSSIPLSKTSRRWARRESAGAPSATSLPATLANVTPTSLLLLTARCKPPRTGLLIETAEGQQWLLLEQQQRTPRGSREGACGSMQTPRVLIACTLHLPEQVAIQRAKR